MKKVALSLLIIGLFTSCKEAVLENSFICFDQSQPVNVSDIASVPSKNQGNFVLSDLSNLEVQQKYILRKKLDTIVVSKSDLDSLVNMEYKNGYVYDKDNHKSFKAISKNDTITWNEVQVDTLFSFADNEIAKWYKSSVILNKKVNGNFQVNYIQYSKSGVKLVQLGTKKDLDNILYKIHIPTTFETKDKDTLHAILSPSRADFRKLLRMKGMEFEL